MLLLLLLARKICLEGNTLETELHDFVIATFGHAVQVSTTALGSVTAAAAAAAAAVASR